jgi:hypothetical protein
VTCHFISLGQGERMEQTNKQTGWRPSLLDRIANGLLLVAFVICALALTYVALLIWGISGMGD